MSKTIKTSTLPNLDANNDINHKNGIFSLLYPDTVFQALQKYIFYYCKIKSYCFPILLKINFVLILQEITQSPHNSNFMKRLAHSVMQNVSIFNVFLFFYFSGKADIKI